VENQTIIEEAIALCSKSRRAIATWLAATLAGFVVACGLAYGSIVVMFLGGPSPAGIFFPVFILADAVFLLALPVTCLLASMWLSRLFGEAMSEGRPSIAASGRAVLRRFPLAVWCVVGLVLALSLLSWPIVTLVFLPYLAGRIIVLPSVTALEETRHVWPTLKRAWHLTRFWRIRSLGLALAIMTPPLLLYTAVGVVGTAASIGDSSWLALILLCVTGTILWAIPALALQSVAYRRLLEFDGSSVGMEGSAQVG
jgi:hypothetical protein